jgi:hypothetical protein
MDNAELKMDYTFDNDTVSDLHKDAYGFRPSELFWEEWIGATDAERQAIWDSLERALEVSMEIERETEQRAIDRFEALVQVNIDAGAEDRETALRWIMDNTKCNGDWEFLCWEYGLPYRYFERA